MSTTTSPAGGQAAGSTLRHEARSPHIRALRRDEMDLACDVLARSFWDDPLQEYLFPDHRPRYQRLRIEFRLELNALWRKGVVHTTDDLSGIGVWAAPDRWRSDRSDMIRSIIPSVRAFGLRLPVAMDLLKKMEGAHPREPHWYLAILGTDPSRTGMGVGGALIRAVTERCDRDGIPAYLESSKFSNIAYYRRFGFEQTGEITLEGGPSLYPMWREPQAPT